MIQMLQIRGNIVWEQAPVRFTHDLSVTKFGSYYEGHNTTWHFTFFTEQTDVFGDQQNPTEQLTEDFNLVPVLTECKNTAHFPIQTFITKDLQQPALKHTDQGTEGVKRTFGRYNKHILYVWRLAE